jgi:hypothetical protein
VPGLILLRSEALLKESGRRMSQTGEKYLLVFYIPREHTNEVTAAIHATGAGVWPGKTYGEVCFVAPGMGQFSEGADSERQQMFADNS